ncbi:MAG: 1-acyl-sn-glycerol-3-phosphate acyltransferase [Bacteroidetes bacterium]|nr:1-acyl-sn-glycerol-3-phosphate acyltransferase [Bacteroidota bacterium]MBS1757319.1 1-acyl-sn-glycerol-3-phosphate acyltransferase [Bacteroidota bacterium]
MNILRNFCKAIFSLYAFIVFLLLMFLLFPFAVIASFFGRIKGGNFIYKICRLWADIFMLLTFIYHKNIFEYPKASNHAVVFVFNHISYMDIPILMKTFRRQPIRILAKAEMSKVPVFGFIYRQATVMVWRENTAARAKSLMQLKSVLKKNISIVIAPEGTFNTTHQPLKEFYDGAFKVAIETQTPIQPVIFLDAYNRLHYKSIFSFTPGRSRSVFLQEVPVTGYSVQDVKKLKEQVYNEMQSALIRYRAAWIKPQ